jgi:hypothetical protein
VFVNVMIFVQHFLQKMNKNKASYT